MKRLLTLLVLFNFATPAHALFNAQLSIGMGKLEPEDTQDETEGPESTTNLTSLNLNVHMDPIPMVPIAFGVFVSSRTFKMEIDDDAVTSQNIDYGGLVYGPEVMVWIPMVPVVVPYFKAAYLMGSHSLSAEYSSDDDGSEAQVTMEATQKTTGMKYGVGLGFDLIPLVSLFLEYSQTQETFETDYDSFEVTSGSSTVSMEPEDQGDQKAQTKSFLLGVSAGL